jgi:hypothetical protein
LELEAEFEPVTRLLVRSINQRLGSLPQHGEFWVRLRPPTLTELESGRQRPSLIKFYRVASFVQIAKVLVDFVEVSCAGHTMLFMEEEFLSTFVKIQYWPGRPPSNPPNGS